MDGTCHGEWLDSGQSERISATNCPGVVSDHVVNAALVLARLLRSCPNMRARPVYQKQPQMVTRRVRARQFRLRPSAEINQVLGYITAVLIKRHKVPLYAVCWLSNHYHAVLQDVLGTICDFNRELHSSVARYVNQMHGEQGSLWSEHQTSRVAPQTPDDLIEQIAYTMANPVAAMLVRFGHSWPGLRACWPAPAKKYRRPRAFFRGKENGGDWPDEVELTFSRPPGYDHLNDAELNALIQSRIQHHEDEARQTADAKRKRFLGRRRILEQRRWHAPTTSERRGISPRIACKDKRLRIEALQRDRDWYVAYCDARDRFNRGERNVTFPYGTFKMRVLHRVNVHPPPI